MCQLQHSVAVQCQVPQPCAGSTRWRQFAADAEPKRKPERSDRRVFCSGLERPRYLPMPKEQLVVPLPPILSIAHVFAPSTW